MFYLISILFIFFLSKEVDCGKSRSGSISSNEIAPLSCKSQTKSGSFIDVDWVAIYKPPSSYLKSGYFYHSKEDPAGWQLTNKDLREKNSILGEIFEQVSKQVKETKDRPILRPFSYIQYNNVFPGNSKVVEMGSAPINTDRKKIDLKNKILKKFTHTDYGNLKGSLIWDKINKRAIWIIHSLPRYLPPFSGEYSFPRSSSANKAHLFLCLNVPYSNIVFILTNLMKSNIKVYEYFAMGDEAAKIEQAKNNLRYEDSATKVFVKSAIRSSMRASMQPSLTQLETQLETFTTTGNHPTTLTMILKPKLDEGDFYQHLRNKLSKNNKITVKTNYKIPNISNYQNQCQQEEIIYALEMKMSIYAKKWRYNEDESEFILGSEDEKEFFCLAYTKGVSCKKEGYSICLFDKNLYQTFQSSISDSNSIVVERS